jgi:hypothetical protein
MIYVKIELWPFGDRNQRKTLGEMVIANDSSGSATKGNYKVWHKTDPEKLLDNTQNPGESLLLRSWLGEMKPDRVEDYPRKAVTIWHLIRRAIEAAGFTGKKPSLKEMVVDEMLKQISVLVSPEAEEALKNAHVCKKNGGCKNGECDR